MQFRERSRALKADRFGGRNRAGVAPCEAEVLRKFVTAICYLERLPQAALLAKRLSSSRIDPLPRAVDRLRDEHSASIVGHFCSGASIPASKKGQPTNGAVSVTAAIAFGELLGGTLAVWLRQNEDAA